MERERERGGKREKYAGLSPCVHSYLKPPLMLAFSATVFPNFRGHWTMGTFLGVTTSIKWVEARDVGKHPTMYRMAPQEKELSGPRHQQCQG